MPTTQPPGAHSKPKQPLATLSAKELLELSRDGLMVAVRFLDRALAQLVFEPSETVALATDGTSILYSPAHVHERLLSSPSELSHDLLHMVLHLVLGHPFADKYDRTDCWDLACDVAVEQIIQELALVQAASADEPRQRELLGQLKAAKTPRTAERLYRQWKSQGLSPADADRLRRPFFRDDHEAWRQNDASEAEANPQQPDPAARLAARNQWLAIGERLAVELDTIARGWASRSGTLVDNVDLATRRKQDYRTFLMRFMSRGEALQVNDDEFDYVYYTYGLKLYRNMPLIEPLEYKDVHKIRDFVIAIDTSGSCSGDLVNRFMQETCAIFEQQTTVFETFNIHVIQCDSAIQKADKLTSLEAFACFRQSIRVRGLGGTDFRPVFRAVDDLLAQHEFTDFKGLIYFTDGHGVFPEQKPAYEAAFVFSSEEGRRVEVPPWAIKVVLDDFESECL